MRTRSSRKYRSRRSSRRLAPLPSYRTRSCLDDHNAIRISRTAKLSHTALACLPVLFISPIRSVWLVWLFETLQMTKPTGLVPDVRTSEVLVSYIIFRSRRVLMIHECVYCNLHSLDERRGAIRGNIFSLTSCNSLAFQASVRHEPL